MTETTRQISRRDALRAGGRLIFQPQSGPAGDVLVQVFLRGGVDSLYLVPPYADPAYRTHRRTLFVAEPGRKEGALDLDGFCGLHPDLRPLHEMFRAGRLAVVQACGSPDRTLSHFEAMKTMERGGSDSGSFTTGWISRHLRSTLRDGSNPLRAVSISDVLPESLRGASGAMALRALAEFTLPIPPQWGERYLAAMRSFYAADDDPAQAAGRQVLNLLEKFQQITAAPYQPDNQAVYPTSPLGRKLLEVARLIKAEVGLEVATVDMGGWDTHVDQFNRLKKMLTGVAQALKAFEQDLGERLKRVTVVVLSEFGRRAYENKGLGTDHGRATAMFVFGGGIRGGKVYGKWPGLERDQLDNDGNLRVTTDYRDVLAELVERRLGNARAAEVFPDHKPQYLNLTT